MNGIADLIGQLKIPPKYWDCSRSDYVALPFVTQGDCPGECITPEGWAFTAGLWDGLLAEVKGVPEGIGAIAKDPAAVAQALGKLITFDGPTWAAIKDKIAQEHSEAAGKPCQISHLVATDIVAVASLVLPLTKLSKANIASTLTNLADNTLLTLTKFKVAGQMAYKTAGGALTIVKNASKLTFQVFKEGDRIWSVYVKNSSNKLFVTFIPVNPNGLASAIKEIKEILKNADGTVMLDENGLQLARAELRNGEEVLVALDEFDDLITSKWNDYFTSGKWDEFQRKSYPVLRKSLGIAEGSGLYAHHKVPIEMLKENRYIQEAVNLGFDFNGFINGKALIQFEHTFTNGKFYPHHANYNKFVRQLINEKTANKVLSDARKILENEILPEVGKFLDEAEAAGKTINDYAISKGY